MAAPTHLPTVTVASATDIGGYAENQDATCILDGGALTAVFDGHGPYGRHLAEWATEWLTEHPAAPFDASTFAEMDEHIRLRLLALLDGTGVPYVVERRAIYHRGFYGSRGGPIRGGTTATLTRVDPSTGAVTVAHVGDSEARVFDIPVFPTAELESEVEREGVSLCGDHTPSARGEMIRIGRSHPGARFICDDTGCATDGAERPVWVSTDSARKLNPMGPFKICDVRGAWGTYLRTADDSEGLAMTRSLGDYNLQRLGGVITVPSVQTLPPPNTITDSPIRERIVVTGSDGFWDMVHYNEVTDVLRAAVSATESTDAIAASLIDLAKTKTIERIGAPGDNISIVVVRVSLPTSSA